MLLVEILTFLRAGDEKWEHWGVFSSFSLLFLKPQWVKLLFCKGYCWLVPNGMVREVVVRMAALISITLCSLLGSVTRTTIQQCFCPSGLSHPSWFNLKFKPVLTKQLIYLRLVLSLCLSNLAAQAQSTSSVPAFQAWGIDSVSMLLT